MGVTSILSNLLLLLSSFKEEFQDLKNLWLVWQRLLDYVPLLNRDSHWEDLKCGLDNAREGDSKKKLPPGFKNRMK